MCGILAIILQHLKMPPPHFLEACAFLDPRGPDRHVITSDEDGFFCFSRLCINGVSKAGDQPFISPDKRVKVMCNGEIYNHKELEERFNIDCESGSDCEVILHLYLQLGFADMVRQLDGVFAIVIVDGDMVYYCRDPIGIRPLFSGQYWKGEESRVTSLTNALHDTSSHSLVLSSIAAPLIRLNDPIQAHFCTGIKQVQPGVLHYYNTSTKILRKFPLALPKPKGIFCNGDSCLNVRNLLKRKSFKDADAWIQTQIKELLVSAVEKRLMSDKPIGCLLSGGLDSSIVASILCSLLGPQNVRTYSIGMEGSVDLKYARLVADHLGSQHTEVKFTPEEGIAAIPDVICALETKDITTIRASVGMYLIAKYIKENTDDTVIMSGEGADEVMCGYLYFHYAPDDKALEEESARLIEELHHYDVLRADRTISENGLELRVPFLDQTFRAFIDSLPEGTRGPREGFEKYILRKAFDDGSLPREVLWRRKDGFSDGVSSVKKSWCEYIKEHAAGVVEKNTCKTKESSWYSELFYSTYLNRCSPSIQCLSVYEPKEEHWMPRWIDCDDPSGRALPVYDEGMPTTTSSASSN